MRCIQVTAYSSQHLLVMAEGLLFRTNPAVPIQVTHFPFPANPIGVIHLSLLHKQTQVFPKKAPSLVTTLTQRVGKHRAADRR